MDRQPASVLTNTLQLMAGPDATPRGRSGCRGQPASGAPAGVSQESSGIIRIAPEGHSLTQIPQPLQ